MLDKDNMISTSVSETIEKIPTDEKHYRTCSFMRFALYSHSMQIATLYSHSMQSADQHIANIEIAVYLLGYIQCC